jgi:AraC-like DNA-binding protein
MTAPPVTGRRAPPDPPDPAALARAYTRGQTVPECAAAFGINEQAVRRVLAVAGITMRPPGPRPGRRTDPVALARAYAAGQSIRQCADASGIDPKTARSMLVAAGVTIRPRGAPADPAAVARAYAGGQTIGQCAARFGISRRVVSRILRDAGTTVRRAWQRGRVDPAAVARAYASGQSVRQCAAAVGISAETARRILRDAGVTMRSPGRPTHADPTLPDPRRQGT